MSPTESSRSLRLLQFVVVIWLGGAYSWLACKFLTNAIVVSLAIMIQLLILVPLYGIKIKNAFGRYLIMTPKRTYMTSAKDLTYFDHIILCAVYKVWSNTDNVLLRASR